jgi:hypothetical protein
VSKSVAVLNTCRQLETGTVHSAFAAQLTTEERVEMERYNRKGPWKQKEDQEEQDFLGVRWCNKSQNRCLLIS